MEEKTLKEHITEVLHLLGETLEEELRQLMIRNGDLLPNDGLVQSVEYQVKESDESLKLLANDYFDYYRSGRKPGARKVPISALIGWIKRYRFKVGQFRDKKGRFISDNRMAFAIQNAIFKNGIARKTYLDVFFTRNEELVNQIIVEETLEFLSDLVIKQFPDKIVIG